MWPFTRKAPIETKALAEPSDDLYALFGIVPTTASTFAVTPEAALRVSAVGSAIRVISEAVACLEVSVKRLEADGTEADVPGHPVLSLLRGEANDWTSGYELLRDLVIDALSDDVGGMAYVNRLQDGRAVEIIRYRRTSMAVEFGLPPSGGPGSILVHDGLGCHGWGGRRSGSGWRGWPVDDCWSWGPISQR
jgi:phage portal protein BeeE